MRNAARIHAIIEALDEIARTPRPADVVLGDFFRQRRYIGSGDRAAIAEGVYELLRHHARIGWWLERNAAPGTPRNRMLAWLMLTGAVPETLSEIFSGTRYAPNPLTDDERRLIKSLTGRTAEHPDMPEAVRLECPAWAEPGLRAALGDRFAAEMTALLSPAPVDLRINPLKGDRATIQAALAAEGVATEPTPLSPLGLRAEGRPPLGGTRVFKEGAIEVQDEGSQLVAALAEVRPGQQVVDFCAGAGGKTMALAAAMANKGRIIACDVHDGRLKRAALRFRRAGLHNIETRALSTESDPWIKRHKGQFDAVLVDAPCTGTGVWRRNPDARWRALGPGLAEMLPLQGKILESAARLVKPGGHLVYATCSLLKEENDDQIAAFLAAHPDFSESRRLALSPAQNNTDGFFAARLTRAA